MTHISLHFTTWYLSPADSVLEQFTKGQQILTEWDTLPGLGLSNLQRPSDGEHNSQTSPKDGWFQQKMGASNKTITKSVQGWNLLVATSDMEYLDSTHLRLRLQHDSNARMPDLALSWTLGLSGTIMISILSLCGLHVSIKTKSPKKKKKTSVGSRQPDRFPVTQVLFLQHICDVCNCVSTHLFRECVQALCLQSYMMIHVKYSQGFLFLSRENISRRVC